ncbi:hepatocyte growth factor-regulated tyrosine kinase substrate [Battus philenor]|uniref:hepatocyte growth factor-regulated tyrosine kinase substrate n=1 Tax=Battus philenor TaxID=42288 RepID=UPI0035D032C2
MFRVNNFDKLLDKATSNLRLEPDWPTILQICDLIRQNDCSPKYAVAAVKKKLYSQNPHQAMFALLTLESIVKNCGSGVHDEVASKAFCEMLRDLVKSTQHENLRNKILELIQAWAFAFRNSPKYRAVQDTVNILKAEGYKFPALKESDAMFSADTAPEWADGEVCHRCRVPFSLMVRRHHCRACGQVFCQQCSSKTSTLPKFGIEKEVRVCDACFDKVSRPPSSTSKSKPPASEISTTQSQPHEKTKEELQEEEELQLALALSQSEAEQKEKERRSRSLVAPETSLHPTISPSASSISASPEHSTVASSELSRYLDRNYWEQRLARDQPAAPTAPASHVSHDTNEPEFSKLPINKAQEDDAEDKEIDEFVESLKSQVEIFVNRMKSNSSRGRSIANDTSVQTLFMNITAMHSRLLRYIQQQDDKRVYLESLQDKVTQVRDSRAALDTLRAEHSARLAAAAEAAERQRQMQMAAKLQAMRKKKHEYLQYQRQLALQRVQEQEREMQMRQEQQKHQYMMSANSYYMPGVSMHHYQPGFPNQPMYASAQFHPQMMPQATTDGTVPLPGQAQMSQANLPMGVNQIGAISQSMPQLTNTYAMTTSGMTLSQAPSTIPSNINQQNRPQLGQQMPLQQQMIMQQMHQMRMPMQPGVHQLMNQNIANGYTGPTSQQNSQQSQQVPKQNMPNQPQANTMPQMPMGQNLNTANSLLGMQMQNMRMPIMQGNQPNTNQQQYSMTLQNQQNNPQAGTQMPNITQPSQIPMTSQSMAMPGQQLIQGQTLPHSQANVTSNIANQNQNVLTQGPQVSQGGTQMAQSQQSQFTQGQQMAMQGQPGQQMMLQGQPMNIPHQNQHSMSQGQQIPQNQMHQVMPQMNQQIMPNNLPQQIPQIPQMPSQMGQQIPGAHQMPTQGQQMPTQGQQMPTQGQHMPPQGQQMPPQGQQMPPQGQQMQPQGQQMPSQGQQQMSTQGQQMIPQGQQMSSLGHQMPPQGQQMAPMGQQMPSQGQQPQIPQNFQGQQIKMQQQNFSNGVQGQQQNPNQQAQTPTKSEHNNNTAELISFD